MNAGEVGEGLDPIARVAAWRGRGSAVLDPVGWCVIEALARRAAGQQGEARQHMLRRMEELLARYAAAESHAVPAEPATSPSTTASMTTAARAAAPAPAACARQAALAGLGGLVDRLGRSPASPTMAASSPRPNAAGLAESAAVVLPLSPTASPPPLKAMAAFKGTWSRLRAEQRLRQALAQVPARAGPMNSSNVMNQALQAMHALSPVYLDAFMLHVDGLLWLEQSGGGAGPVHPVSPPAASAEARRRHTPRGARKR